MMHLILFYSSKSMKHMKRLSIFKSKKYVIYSLTRERERDTEERNISASMEVS